MKVINTILLSALVALGSATAQADTSSAPVLLSNTQLDTVDAGSRYRYTPRTRASASAGGEVSAPGVYANGGADASASGGATSVALADGGAAAIGIRYTSGSKGRKGGYSTIVAGAGIAGGSSYSCSGHCN